MEWTQALRYRNYEDWPAEAVETLKEQVDRSNWRLGYHIQAPTGLLNDPNGFSFYQGKWQLFYQAFPFGPVHGLKSWQHVSSIDLVHWEQETSELLPSTSHDSHGVYSGSALPVKEKLFLAYTGNVRDEKWTRHSYQLGAWMETDGRISKQEKPLIAHPPKEFTAHFRDPQLLQKGKDNYALLIGGQTKEEEGKVLVYQSADLEEWELSGELQVTGDTGFMIECPNLVFPDETPLLLYCPQGMSQESVAYQNVYPNVYTLAKAYSWETHTLEDQTMPQLLDEGFDLYATQAFEAPDGRTLSVSWIGLPEMTYPTFEEGWAHCLSLVKELHVREGKLFQYPVKELEQLRQTHASFSVQEHGRTIKTQNQYEVQIHIPEETQGEVWLFADEKKEEGLFISYDTTIGELILDRSKTTYPLNQAYGEQRKVELSAHTALQLSIFVDRSTCEMFLNEGEKVLTANYYPTEEQTGLFLRSNQKTTVDYYSFT